MRLIANSDKPLIISDCLDNQQDTNFTPQEQPRRFAPAASIASASARERMPPAALTPFSAASGVTRSEPSPANSASEPVQTIQNAATADFILSFLSFFTHHQDDATNLSRLDRGLCREHPEIIPQSAHRAQMNPHFYERISPNRRTFMSEST